MMNKNLIYALATLLFFALGFYGRDTIFEFFVSKVAEEGVSFTSTRNYSIFRVHMLITLAVGILPLAHAFARKISKVQKPKEQLLLALLIIGVTFVTAQGRIIYLKNKFGEIGNYALEGETITIPIISFNIAEFLLAGVIIGAILSGKALKLLVPDQ